MPWQCSFKKLCFFCSNYAKNYASTIRQGLIGPADLAKNFLRTAGLNSNFSGSADPLNLMDSDFGKNRVRITDSKHTDSSR